MPNKYQEPIRNTLDKRIVESIPNSIRIDTIIELKRGHAVVGTMPYFTLGCPIELGTAQHKDSVCISCMPRWEKAGFSFGHVLDFAYSLKLVDTLRERGW